MNLRRVGTCAQRLSGPVALWCQSAFILSGILLALISSSRLAFAARAIVTDQGPLKGKEVPGETEYLGIPYAAPPVGNLRWMPPQPPAKFRGLFEATKFGSPCTQTVDTPSSENCLYLNVYTPSGKAPKSGFPVMVWIHGGGLVFGAGSDYDPTPIVEGGDVIVVTINYRLGFFGFFAHPAIDAESHLLANYGLMDQQFALQWVRRNIAEFGGNPKQVTIFGESAGGFSVLSNVASPTAAGLFIGGIVESGGYAEFQDYWDPLSVVSLATAESVGTVFIPGGTTIAANVGCTSQTTACLRSVSAAALLAQEGTIAFPIVDGTVLTQNLDSAFGSGEFNRVPVLAGTNHDEWRDQVALEYDLAGHPLTDAGYPAAVYAYFLFPYPTPDNPFADFLINFEYPLSNYPPPAGYSVSAPLALGALGTDEFFVCAQRNGELKLSQYVPMYVYEFHDETAPPFFPPLTFPQGDSHFIEVEYLFDLSALGIVPTFNGDQQRLSNTMIAYWTNFAKTGNPNAAELPEWPQFVGGGSLESLVAPTPVSEKDASFDADHKCSSFWNTF